MQAQEGNIYFTELAERVEYGNYAFGSPTLDLGRRDFEPRRVVVIVIVIVIVSVIVIVIVTIIIVVVVIVRVALPSEPTPLRSTSPFSEPLGWHYFV